MRHNIVIVVIALALATAAVAQMAPVPSAPAPLPPNNSGAVVTGGYATSAAPSAPLVVTPNVTLGLTSPNPVGATNATANNVGARNSTLNTEGAPMPAVLPPAQVIDMNHLYVTAAVAQSASPAALGERPMLVGGFLPVSSSVYSLAGQPDNRTLAEISAQYRNGRHARKVYTNDDIARLNSSNLSSPGQPAAETPATTSGATGVVGGAPSAVLPASDQPMIANPSDGGILPPNVAAPAVTTEQPAPAAKPNPSTPPSDQSAPVAPPKPPQ